MLVIEITLENFRMKEQVSDLENAFFIQSQRIFFAGKHDFTVEVYRTASFCFQVHNPFFSEEVKIDASSSPEDFFEFVFVYDMSQIPCIECSTLEKSFRHVWFSHYSQLQAHPHNSLLEIFWPSVAVGRTDYKYVSF